MTTRCDRAWQAEAAEDGRLGDADRASFARHMATCAACAREAAALAELRQAGARLPVLSSTPLEQRRQRHELLRRANDLAVRPERRSWARAALLALAAAAVVAVGYRLAAPDPPPVARDVPIPRFQVLASQDADWHPVERSATLRIAARRGRLELAVDPLRTGQRFLLELPDGEIEVRGTRFVVDTDGTRTVRVHVVEGEVVLRRRAHAAVALTAGDTWAADSAAASVPTAPSADSVGRGATGAVDRVLSAEPPARGPAHPPAAPATRPTDRLAPAARAAERARPARRGELEERGPREDAAPDARDAPDAKAAARGGADFARAVAAFSAGDYGEADQLFLAFERGHPADARVEDAVFLRAVAHSRRGDRSASRAVAAEYLARFPSGLRRADAERLAR